MTALTFTHDALRERWTGYQPDGVRVGHVRRSRKTDERYAYEALIDTSHDQRHRHCGYGDTPAAAMWMLVCGCAHRFT